jgi:hypothetical protein
MDRTYKNQALMQFLGLQQQAAQVGAVTAQNIYSTLVDIAENFGIMDVGSKVTDPGPPQPPAPPPPSEAQVFAQTEQLKADLKSKADAEEREFEAYKLRVEDDRKRDQMIQDLQLKIAELAGKYATEVNIAAIEADQNKQRTNVDWAISQNEAEARRKQEEAERQQQIQAQMEQAAAMQAQAAQQQMQPPMPPQI